MSAVDTVVAAVTEAQIALILDLAAQQDRSLDEDHLATLTRKEASEAVEALFAAPASEKQLDRIASLRSALGFTDEERPVNDFRHANNVIRKLQGILDNRRGEQASRGSAILAALEVSAETKADDFPV